MEFGLVDCRARARQFFYFTTKKKAHAGARRSGGKKEEFNRMAGYSGWGEEIRKEFFRRCGLYSFLVLKRIETKRG
jgi:hypothetical protein